MKQLKTILQLYRPAILWTGGYVATLWVIMYTMFGFDLLSTQHWGFLFNTRLHGFAGFVFGICLVAAIPLYAATVTLILRKKTIFSFKPEKKKVQEPVITKIPEPEPEPNIALPSELPREMIEPYLRAQKRLKAKIAVKNFDNSFDNSDAEKPASTVILPMTETKPQSNSDTRQKNTNLNNISVTEIRPNIQSSIPVDFSNSGSEISENETGILPLPDEFDFGDDSGDAFDAPVFREINFNSPKEEESNSTDESSESSSESEIQITDKHVIAIHDDSDFWICDETEWFASGKRKPNPIALILSAANGTDLQPVLCLHKKNIMDLDAKKTEWESAGVKVIEDLSEL